MSNATAAALTIAYRLVLSRQSARQSSANLARLWS